MYNALSIIEYDGHTVRDISKSVDVVAEAKMNASAMDNYIIQDGETPESLAHDFYNDVNLNWVILNTNDIVDPFYDWPLNQTELTSLVESVYGSGQGSMTHHWELDGHIVPSTTAFAYSVSNYTFEEQKNDEKRKIKILKEEWIKLVKSNLNSLDL